MRNCKLMVRASGFVLAFAGLAGTAAGAPKLTFKFRKANVPGALYTEPGGINNAGVIVGLYADSNGLSHGYILKGNDLTTLDDPKGQAGTTGASNLAPNGTIWVVGSYINSSGNYVGFQYKNGRYLDVPGPTGAVSSVATGINDHGVIVGYYTDSGSTTHGFLLNGKGYSTLDVPGATATYATDVNDKENIVLYWLNSAGAYESSLYNGKTYKTYKTINVPGAEGSGANALNNEGDVVYGWIDSGGVTHGALLHAGKYHKFDYPKSAFSGGDGINDNGAIVGVYGDTSNAPDSGFEATYK